eukprot:scaffold90431_cov26-Tisochrysis_lutea.AAC.1
MEHRATACSSMPMHFLTLLSVAVLWKKRTEQENLSRPDKAACIKGIRRRVSKKAGGAAGMFVDPLADFPMTVVGSDLGSDIGSDGWPGIMGLKLKRCAHSPCCEE